mgnify:CR=1 FL=1
MGSEMCIRDRSGFYDYGPLGTLLKRNIVDIWRLFFVTCEDNIEIECPTITPEDVLVASGHVNSFVDYVVVCERCKAEYRADHLIKDVKGKEVYEIEEIKKELSDIRCPNCGSILSRASEHNLMFRTETGLKERKTCYARPETAQGIFTDFRRIYKYVREKLPIGVAQVGKVYRNEISPRKGMLRLREFTIAEVEFFYLNFSYPKAHYHVCFYPEGALQTEGDLPIFRDALFQPIEELTGESEAMKRQKEPLKSYTHKKPK